MVLREVMPPELGWAQYQEADPSLLKRLPKANLVGRQALLAQGFRVRTINDFSIEFEPGQEGVFRYPPVQVQYPRRPDYISSYINMGPTDWAEVIEKWDSDNEDSGQDA
jgi:hypothetical protein